MTTPSRPSPASRRSRLKAAQSGMTLLEVLVSMFVLAVGVLALLAVQLRSVSSVREAEGQTIVSQITQNLVEGMLINPVLSAATEESTGIITGWTHKSYEHYATAGQQASPATADCYPVNGSVMDKNSLRDAQICQFSTQLAQSLPETEVHFAICQDTSGQEPTYNGSFSANCNGNAGTTVIKVLWLADMETDSDEDTGGSSNLTKSGNYAVYTYQARVTD